MFIRLELQWTNLYIFYLCMPSFIFRLKGFLDQTIHSIQAFSNIYEKYYSKQVSQKMYHRIMEHCEKGRDYILSMITKPPQNWDWGGLGLYSSVSWMFVLHYLYNVYTYTVHKKLIFFPLLKFLFLLMRYFQ